MLGRIPVDSSWLKSLNPDGMLLEAMSEDWSCLLVVRDGLVAMMRSGNNIPRISGEDLG